MKLEIAREALLPALQQVAGVVERRQTLPILANVLLDLKDNQLSLTGTDLEVELIGFAVAEKGLGDGRVTVPARKVLEICKAFDDGSLLAIESQGEHLLLRSGRSRYRLATLPAEDFPNVESTVGLAQFEMEASKLRRLIDQTGFAMAQQDVRFYLNGMLFETGEGRLRTVATDGHRLAMCTLAVDSLAGSRGEQVIVPRKGTLEIARLLKDEGTVRVTLGQHHIRVEGANFVVTSKLVDGKFPDYEKVIPQQGLEGEQELVGDRRQLREAFARTAILSNEKYRGVRLSISEDELTVQASNPEQEEAIEPVPVAYPGDALEIGFNVSYLIDVMSAITAEQVRFRFSSAESSVLIQPFEESADCQYVVMPMKL